MSATETWTIGKLLTWTTEYLQKHGSDSPRLDAEVLLAHARGCRRIELYTEFSEEPAAETRTAFREMVRRRAEGAPVAYLVGHKEFYSTSFEVNPDVLIPRPETEHLVVAALDRAAELRATRTEPLRIADVGTGSGIIAVVLAQRLPDCRVTAIDLSPSALVVARRNVELHGVGARVDCVQGDLLNDIDAVFDLIVSNPPYVSEAEYEQLEPGVRNFEPRQALVAGPTGLECVQRLLTQSVHRLADDGYVLCEISPMLADKLPECLDAGWETPRFTKDLAGWPRVVTLSRQR